MIEQFKFYKARIDYSTTHDLRENTLPNGSLTHLQSLWIADYDERFSGDMIFQPAESPFWIPERDLNILNEITKEEFYDIQSKRQDYEA
jgi:hypothetical protein